MVKFSKSHEWVSVTDGIAVVGISDHAQKELGDIVFVELPQAGTALARDAQFGTVESTKAASEVYAPVSGEVLESNKEVAQNPQWINEDPMGKGWMIKIQVANPAEVDDLMDEPAYKEFIAREKH